VVPCILLLLLSLSSTAIDTILGGTQMGCVLHNLSPLVMAHAVAHTELQDWHSDNEGMRIFNRRCNKCTASQSRHGKTARIPSLNHVPFTSRPFFYSPAASETSGS
jgi:hypothetical protein